MRLLAASCRSCAFLLAASCRSRACLARAISAGFGCSCCSVIGGGRYAPTSASSAPSEAVPRRSRSMYAPSIAGSGSRATVLTTRSVKPFVAATALIARSISTSPAVRAISTLVSSCPSSRSARADRASVEFLIQPLGTLACLAFELTRKLFVTLPCLLVRQGGRLEALGVGKVHIGADALYLGHKRFLIGGQALRLLEAAEILSYPLGVRCPGPADGLGRADFCLLGSFRL